MNVSYGLTVPVRVRGYLNSVLFVNRARRLPPVFVDNFPQRCLILAIVFLLLLHPDVDHGFMPRRNSLAFILPSNELIPFHDVRDKVTTKAIIPVTLLPSGHHREMTNVKDTGEQF